jgi:tRNA pseudouridine55 synthase
MPADRLAIDGALIIDKPRGLTSHDVVAAVRRALGERRVGHTGTLDPLATGVLPLLLGRAARRAPFLSGADKAYEAHVRFGWETDTDDETGKPVSPPVPARFSGDDIDRALVHLRGVIRQQPPAFSAKRIGGRRAYDIARAAGNPALKAAEVTVSRFELREAHDDRAVLFVECSAGCYVRALVRDMGRLLGSGAHLSGLRRVRSGRFAVDQAIPLGEALQDPEAARTRIVSPAEVLGDVPVAHLTAAAAGRARHGVDVEVGEDTRDLTPGAGSEPLVRLVDPEGRLVGIARPGARPGFLHPVVVLV